jgi:outer membrane protein assembly factor BamB
MRWWPVLMPLVLVACLLALVPQSGSSNGWPQWRGPTRDGAAADFAAPSEWPAALAKQWSVRVGVGHASPVVAGGRVFVHARRESQEVVLALDSATGKEIWRDAYDAPYRVNPAAAGHGPGPKSTPAVAAGRLVTFGISGILSCYDAASGALRWRKQPSAEQPLYGTAMSPLVEGGLAIVHAGGHERGALTAFDLETGAVRWRWTGGAPAYASPVAATLSGVRQIITQSRTHLVGVAAAGGRLLWQVPFTTDYDQNAVTPLVWRDLIVYSGLATGTHAVRPVERDGTWRVVEVWSNPEVSMYMSSPVATGEALYGLSHRNRGQFVALDARTGKLLWSTRGREGDNAAVVTTRHAVLALTTGAELVVFEPSTTGFAEIRRYDVADSATWAHPALAGRQILVKDEETVSAWTLRN